MSEVMDRDHVISKLKNMIQLDYDAIEAYKAAIDRLENDTYKNKLRDFLKDHERHVQELSNLVKDKGATPPESGDAKSMLTKGKVVLADLGNDKHILQAMKTNEDETNTKYEQATKEDFPQEVLSILERGLKDERHHRAWIESTLDNL